MSHQTPLFDYFQSIDGVKLTEYSGWTLPLSFGSGIVHEHRAVRTAAGVYDVSHMGRILVRGSGASEYVDRLITVRLPPAGSDACRYTFLCAPDGGCIDDVLVYRLADDAVGLAVNAANREAVLAWLESENPYARRSGRVSSIDDVTFSTAQIAVQGPQSGEIVSRLTGGASTNLHFYLFSEIG